MQHSITKEVPHTRLRWCCALFALAWLAGCAEEAPRQTAGVLRLATTTSMRDSGLLEQLLPIFEKEHDCRVDVVAVGTGAALKLGEAGDADIVIVHSRPAEEAFMQAGHGIRHELFTRNEFIILGPPDDPAEIRGMQPIEALQKIAAAGQPFVSRGDDSGTHKREEAMWKRAGGRPTWEGYLETGQGMGPTLIVADEMRGYTLCDGGTYLNFKQKIELESLAAPAEILHNPYAVMVVDPRKNDQMNPRLAQELAKFLISPQAQKLIRDYRLNGRQLFHPTRLTKDGRE